MVIILRWMTFLAGVAFCVSCGVPDFDIESELGRNGLLFETNSALTSGDCTRAISLIDSLYQSSHVNNQVRLLRASAYGCAAGIEYFPLLANLGSKDLNPLTGAFWQTLTELFPSSLTDTKLEAGWYAQDALLASLNSGIVLLDSNKVTLDTYNTASLKTSDREEDANLYLPFIDFSIIGSTQNRYGTPNASYKQTTSFSWTTYSAMNETGCAYAGAIVNMLEGIDVLVQKATSSLNGDFQTIQSAFSVVFDAACNLGCQGTDPTNPGFDDTTDCNTTCSTCPIEIRQRSSCLSNRKARCAAAGLVRFQNAGILGAWPNG